MKSTTLARLGRDAELKYLQDGTPVANLALAYNYGRKGQDGKRPTQWVQASIFGKRAETLTQYLTKGTAIVAYLGDVHVRTFNKQDGTEGHALNAKLDDLDFIPGQQRQQQASQSAPQQNPGYGFQQPQQNSTQIQGGPVDNGLDDDIPFSPVDWRTA